ncbi:hypothetical protein ACNKHR_08215 [Shigella flexneri]
MALAGMMFVTRNIDWYAFSLPKMKASKEVTRTMNYVSGNKVEK